MSAKLKIKRGLLSNWEANKTTLSLEPGQLGVAYRGALSPILKVGGGGDGVSDSTWESSFRLNADPYIYSDTGIYEVSGDGSSSRRMTWGDGEIVMKPGTSDSEFVLLDDGTGVDCDTVLTSSGTFYSLGTDTSSLGTSSYIWNNAYFRNSYSVTAYANTLKQATGQRTAMNLLGNSDSLVIGGDDTSQSYFSATYIEGAYALLSLDTSGFSFVLNRGIHSVSFNLHDDGTDKTGPAISADSTSGYKYLGTYDKPWTKTYTKNIEYVGTDTTSITSSNAITSENTLNIISRAPIETVSGEAPTYLNILTSMFLASQWRYITIGSSATTNTYYNYGLSIRAGTYGTSFIVPWATMTSNANGIGEETVTAVTTSLGTTDYRFGDGYFSGSIYAGYANGAYFKLNSNGLYHVPMKRTSISSNTEDTLLLESSIGTLTNSSSYYLRSNIQFRVASKYSSNSSYMGYLHVSKETNQAYGGVVLSSTTTSSSTGTAASMRLVASELVSGCNIRPYTSSSLSVGTSAYPFAYGYFQCAYIPYNIYMSGSYDTSVSTYCSKIMGNTSYFYDYNDLKCRGLTIECAPPGLATAASTSPYNNNYTQGSLKLNLVTRSTSYNSLTQSYTASNDTASLLFVGHGDSSVGVYPSVSTDNGPCSYLGNLINPWSSISSQQYNIIDDNNFEAGTMNSSASINYSTVAGDWAKAHVDIQIDAPSATVDTHPTLIIDTDDSGHIWIHTNEDGGATSEGGSGASSAMLYFGSNDHYARNVYTQLVCIKESIYPYTTNIAELGQDKKRWKNIYTVNAVTVGSDRNMKDSIQYLDEDSPVSRDEVVDFIKRLKPATFCYKHPDVDVATEDNTEDNGVQIGFIAQDMEEVSPKLFRRVGVKDVSVENEELGIAGGEVTYSLQDLPLTATAIIAIQELMKENEQLKARLTAIEEKLLTL